MHVLLIAAIALLPLGAVGQAPENKIQAVVDEHILPGFSEFASTATALSEAALADCSATSSELRSAFNHAFDAWLAVSHLRFGPTEAEDRAFALAFWPDPRGSTPKTLAAMIQGEDAAVDSAASYATVSVAARGFYALEFMLYDSRIMKLGADSYRCRLVRAITADIDANARGILRDWRKNYVDLFLSAGANDTYRSSEEALQELYKALVTGLQFNSDVRLGRPLGTFERPRPKRAEARRSRRSLRNVALSLTALNRLSELLSMGHPDIAGAVDDAFDHAAKLAEDLDDPIFEGVSDPAGRLKIEILQQAINSASETVVSRLGPSLGVIAGFNALDGD